jgi:tetratricopeptide (TPR) repeat protein
MLYSASFADCRLLIGERMAPKRKQTSKGGASHQTDDRVGLRHVPGENVFELVHPRCVRARADDIAEVHKMLKAGELDIAEDELRWLLDGCSQFVEAHRLLGEIAMADGDAVLARGHFGYAFQIVVSSLPKQGLPRPLPYRRPPNRPFFEAGKGLVWALQQMGEANLAAEVIQQMLSLDPSDPLKLPKP